MVYIVGTDNTYVTFKIILKILVKKMPRQLKTLEKKTKKKNKTKRTINSLSSIISLFKKIKDQIKFFFLFQLKFHSIQR